MKIDGKLIAAQIKENLKKKILLLKRKNIIPHLAVILIGDDPSSQTYVKQKQKVGEELGVKVSFFPLEQSDTRLNLVLELKNLTKKLNDDPLVHGIIIQRPCPINISKEELDLLVNPQKDVDGFHPQSPFTPPIASAVLKILESAQKAIKTPRGWQAERSEAMTPFRVNLQGEPQMVKEFSKDFTAWLKKQKILVIGRGETAGKPITETLQKMGINPVIAHSKTTNLKELCLKSDIIISCVGKRPILRRSNGRTQNGPYIVRLPMLKPATLLIGVGLHQENGKLQTDYDQEEIADKVAFYTPVPGGVGPVNVACLFENLVISYGTVRGFF